MLIIVDTGDEKPSEVQYTNDILAMISPEGEKVSLGKVRLLYFQEIMQYKDKTRFDNL